MAKETRLETDGLDLDFNLDFNFDPENTIRSKVTKEARDKKSRTPVQETFSGIIAEAKTKLSDPGFLSKVTKKALPDQYGELIEALDKGAGTLSSIYEETLKDLKPQLIKLNKSVDKIIPDEQKFLKNITSKIKEKLGDELPGSYKESNESLKEQSISNSLSEVFQQQRDFDIELQARKSAEDKISRSIDEVRYAKNLDIFQTISDNTIRLTTYTEKVTQAYQKKSLELQFRNYFAVSELLQEYKRNSEVRRIQTDSIVKNTSLPEYVKVNNNERFKDLARNKLFNTIQDNVFGGQNVLGNALNNLKSQTKDFTSGFRSSLENVNFGLQSLQDMKEQEKFMKELGMEVPSKYSMLGNVVGSGLMDFLGNQVSSKVKGKIDKNSKFSKFGFKAVDFINNLNPNINNLRNSNFINENSFSGGVKGSLAGLANFGLDLFNTKGADLRLGNNNIADLSSATSFDKRSYITVTDIIPGYLSRIHRELLALRTNNPNAEQTIFDYRTGKFSTSTRLTNDIKKTLNSTIKGSSYNYFLNRTSNDLLGENNLSKDQLNKVRGFLSEISSKDMLFTPDAIRGSKEFKSLDSSTAKLVSEMLDKKISNSDNPEKGQYDFTKSIMSLRNATPNIKRDILQFYKLGYGDILEEQGIITIDNKGEANLNFDKYKEIIKDQSVFGLEPEYQESSNPTSTNNEFRNRRFRRNVSTDKSFIRPTRVSNNKEAISQLINQLDTLIKEQDNILLGIKNDTSNLATIKDLLEKSPRATVGGINTNQGTESKSSDTRYRTGNTYKDILLNLISDTIDAGSKLGKDIFKGMSTTSDQANLKVVKPVSDFVSKLYKDNKDDTIGLFKRIFKAGSELAIGAIDFSKNIFNNFIPERYKQLVNSVMKVKEDILDFIEGPLDIYIKGIKTPVIRANLMRIGYYFDQETGKVIKSIKDIKGPVVDKLGNVVLTIDDIKNGLFDMTGKEITGKITNFGKLLAKLGLEGLNRVKNFGLNTLNAISNTNVGDKLKSLFSLPTNTGDEKSYNVLIEIRDILKIIARVNVQNSDDPSAGTIKYSSNNVLDTFLKKGKEASDKRKQKQQNKESFNDTDKDGKRDGSFIDRLDAIKNRRKNKTSQENNASNNKPEQRYRSSENIIDTIFGKAKGLLDMLTSGVGGIFNIASTLLGKTSGIAGMIGKAAGAVGSVVSSPLSAIGGMLGAGKLASSIGGITTAAKSALLAGSLATTGTGSAILGIAGATLSAITAVLTSPVTIGIIATTAAGYGLYKGYKYLTRDKLDKFQDIRIKQYGLTNSNEDVEYNHKILELEEYLVDESVIGYRDGQAYILPRKFDTLKVLSMFSIDPKDNESVNNFQSWFNKRFKPFFLTHVTGLFNVNNKAKLTDIDDLDINEQIRYLELVSFESGPYNELTSPFKSKYELTNTKQLVSDTIKNVLQILSKERLKSGKDNSKAKNLSRTIINNTVTSKGLVTEEIKINRNNKEVVNKDTKIDFNISEDGGKQSKVIEPIYNKISNIGKMNEAIGAINDGRNAGQFINLANGAKLDNVNPTMLQQLKGMIQEYGELTGKSTTITSGSRSPQEQAKLYQQNPKKAAKPGTSLHEFGLAVDMDSKALNEMEELGLMRKYGFTRPVGGEPWHIEAAGIQANIRGAKEDSNLADQLIAASVNKGGGGMGTISNSPLGKRDTNYALSLMDIKPNVIDPSKNSDESQTLIATNTRVVPDIDQNNKDIRRVALTGGFTSSIDNLSKGNVTSENGYIAGGISSDTETKPIPRDKEEVKKQIADTAKDIGADPTKLQAFAAVESSLDPNASNGNAQGLYQFMPSTFREQVNKNNLPADANPKDIEDSTIAANGYINQNTRTISSVKSDVNLTDMYLAHLAGPNGAKKLLSVLKSDPNKLAADVLPNAAKGNRNLFYKNNKALTVVEFYNNLSSLLENKSKNFGISIPFGSVSVPDTSIDKGTSSDVTTTGNENTVNVNDNTSIRNTNRTTQPTYESFRPPEITTSKVSDGNMNGILNVTKGIEGSNDLLARQLEVQTKTYNLINEFVEIYKKRSNNDIDNKQGVQKVENNDMPDIKQRTIVSAVDLNRKAG